MSLYRALERLGRAIAAEAEARAQRRLAAEVDLAELFGVEFAGDCVQFGDPGLAPPPRGG
jgi:hypothetical protein